MKSGLLLSKLSLIIYYLQKQLEADRPLYVSPLWSRILLPWDQHDSKRKSVWRRVLL